MDITEPGTIDDLVRDADQAGHLVTSRLITDWVAKGLLDRPDRRPRGRGKGSAKALYTPEQRKLFLTLLGKRSEGAHQIDRLARVPIFLWLYAEQGMERVPTRQVVRALHTWLRDCTTNKDRAAELAKKIMHLLDHPQACPGDKRRLKHMLVEINLTGKVADRAGLERAARDVFEPATVFGPIVRVEGHPATMLTVDGFMGLVDARLVASAAIRAERVTEAELEVARREYQSTRADYRNRLPEFHHHAPEHLKDIFAPSTSQDLFDTCGLDLMTLLGCLRQHAARRHPAS